MGGETWYEVILIKRLNVYIQNGDVGVTEYT